MFGEKAVGKMSDSFSYWWDMLVPWTINSIFTTSRFCWGWRKRRTSCSKTTTGFLMGQKLEQQYPLLVQVAIQEKSLQIELFWDVYGIWLLFYQNWRVVRHFPQKRFFQLQYDSMFFFPRFLFKFLLNRVCRIQWAPKNHNSSNDNDKNQKWSYKNIW